MGFDLSSIFRFWVDGFAYGILLSGFAFIPGLMINFAYGLLKK